MTIEYIAMTPSQYRVITGLEAPCIRGQGVICKVEGDGTGVSLKALTTSFTEADDIACKLNTVEYQTKQALYGRA